VGNDAQFARFCEIAGKTEWARDPRFAANAERVKRRDVLVPLIEAVMHTRTQGEWLAALEAVGVPCGPINRLDQVFADPQVRARGMRFDLPHRLSGTVPQVGNPLHFSATPVAYTQAPPLLGEHTSAVLSQRLGLSAESLADLAARGVVEVCSPG
jgi:crotonobetainyl-CoA:carnitine CoA-transferase CaiB-like acyl-CoA transferase